MFLVVVLVGYLVDSMPKQRSEDGAGSPDFGGLADFLASPTDSSFATVTPGRSFSFPDDHGPHPDYRQEWWYFTGRLSTTDNRVFGYQLTFFRFAGGRRRGRIPHGQAISPGWPTWQ